MKNFKIDCNDGFVTRDIEIKSRIVEGILRIYSYNFFFNFEEKNSLEVAFKDLNFRSIFKETKSQKFIWTCLKQKQ